jgi:hypothetical protein
VEGVDAELARVLVEDARVALAAPARAPVARGAKQGAVTARIAHAVAQAGARVVTFRARFVADVTGCAAHLEREVGLATVGPETTTFHGDTLADYAPRVSWIARRAH